MAAPRGTPTASEIHVGELADEAQMFSSRQRALFERSKDFGIAGKTDIKIDDITFAAIPKLQNIFPNMKSYPNVFMRTKINLTSTVSSPTVPMAPNAPLSPLSPPASLPAAGVSPFQSSSVVPSVTEAKSGSDSSSALVLPRKKVDFRLTYNQMIQDGEVVMMDIVRRAGKHTGAKAFIRAGPRKDIVWRDGEVRAAIVTCGGLCPGLNDVIQELFNCLYYNYGVDVIYGIKAGFRGFWQSQFQPWEPLTVAKVRGISEKGGSILGASRGGFDATRILNACEVYGVNQVFIIGGDGTHRAAAALQDVALARKMKLVVACVPKTIDNDIGVIDHSFGFNTAVQEATKAIKSVVVESVCFPNGIGIVKLMGRHAGYISCHATLASRQVDICLIPEVAFPMHGPHGLLRHVQRVLKRQGYVVIVIAEGAGSDLLASSTETDAGGNKKLPDVGSWLKNEIQSYFKKEKTEVNIKYVDPSYMIRSVPADAPDSIYCLNLAHNAVHGAMAGYTGFTSALVNNRTVMLPISVITSTSPSYLNPSGRTWERVVSLTQQPNWGHPSTVEETEVKEDTDDKEHLRKEWGSQNSPDNNMHKSKL